MSNRPSTKKSSSARVAQARRADAGSNRVWILAAAGVLIVVVALVVAVLATRESVETTGAASSAGYSSEPAADLVYGKVTVTGTALPELPAAPAADPAVGLAAPVVAGQRFDGQPITIPTAGRPTVVTVVAHWCPHCRKEVPVIADHLGGQLPTDVDLFAVASGTAENQPNFPPASWLRKEDWPVPTLVDDAQGTAAKAYGLSGYPFFVAIDASGKVVARQSGELTTAQFDALLVAARGGAR